MSHTKSERRGLAGLIILLLVVSAAALFMTGRHPDPRPAVEVEVSEVAVDSAVTATDSVSDSTHQKSKKTRRGKRVKNKKTAPVIKPRSPLDEPV